MNTAVIITLIVIVIVCLFICKQKTEEAFVNTSGTLNKLRTDEMCLGKYCIKERDIDDVVMGVGALSAGVGHLLEANNKICINDKCITPTDKICYGENCLTSSEVANVGAAIRLSNGIDLQPILDVVDQQPIQDVVDQQPPIEQPPIEQPIPDVVDQQQPPIQQPIQDARGSGGLFVVNYSPENVARIVAKSKNGLTLPNDYIANVIDAMKSVDAQKQILSGMFGRIAPMTEQEWVDYARKEWDEYMIKKSRNISHIISFTPDTIYKMVPPKFKPLAPDHLLRLAVFLKATDTNMQMTKGHAPITKQLLMMHMGADADDGWKFNIDFTKDPRVR